MGLASGHLHPCASGTAQSQLAHKRQPDGCRNLAHYKAGTTTKQGLHYYKLGAAATGRRNDISWQEKIMAVELLTLLHSLFTAIFKPVSITALHTSVPITISDVPVPGTSCPAQSCIPCRWHSAGAVQHPVSEPPRGHLLLQGPTGLAEPVVQGTECH